MTRNPDGVVDVALPALIEPGDYNLAFQYHRTAVIFNSPKLELVFQIADHGRYFGTHISRWYNVKSIRGKPRKSGSFKAVPLGDFLREYLSLFPQPRPRLDRISFQPFRQNLVQGRIETVKQNRKQQAYPPAMQYSVIRELIGSGA